MGQERHTNEMQLKAFELLSSYLNEMPDLINEKMVRELVDCSGYNEEQAFAILLSAACNLDLNKEDDMLLFHDFLQPAIHLLHEEEYTQNPYYRNIRFECLRNDRWELKYEHYKPFEAFVCNDILIMPDGHQLPQIGFFRNLFTFPAVLENGRIWMTVTPNEIETMKKSISDASGRVLTYGLGLGYYAYMASEKEEVDSVTIVDQDRHVIQLFQQAILPQFSHPEKIHIEESDAFRYAEKSMLKENFDFVFTDLWHDVSDGIPLYLRMKKYEQKCPQTKFAYWIESSMKCYM